MMTKMVDWMPGTGSAMTELAQQQGQGQQRTLDQDIQAGTGFDPQQYAQHMTDMYAPQGTPRTSGGDVTRSTLGVNEGTMEQMYNMSLMSPDAEGKQSPNLMADLYNESGANKDTLNRIRGQQDKEDAIPEGGYPVETVATPQGKRRGGADTREEVLPPDRAPISRDGQYVSEDQRRKEYSDYTAKPKRAPQGKRRGGKSKPSPTASDIPNRYISPDRSGPGYPEDPNAVDVPDVLTPIEEIDPSERISGVPGHAGPPMGGNTVGGGAPDAPLFPGHPHGPGQNFPPGFQMPTMPPRVTNPPVIFGPRENPFIGPMIPDRQGKQMPINIDPLKRPFPQFPPQSPTQQQLRDLKNQAQMNKIFY